MTRLVSVWGQVEKISCLVFLGTLAQREEYTSAFVYRRARVERTDFSAGSLVSLLPCPAAQVLDDVTEYTFTPRGVKKTHLQSILLNGNNITMLVPGGDPEEIEQTQERAFTDKTPPTK